MKNTSFFASIKRAVFTGGTSELAEPEKTGSANVGHVALPFVRAYFETLPSPLYTFKVMVFYGFPPLYKRWTVCSVFLLP